MRKDPYETSIEQLHLDSGTLTQLMSAGISNVGQAIDLINDELNIANAFPDLEALDLDSLETAILAAGFSLDEDVDDHPLDETTPFKDEDGLL